MFRLYFELFSNCCSKSCIYSLNGLIFLSITTEWLDMVERERDESVPHVHTFIMLFISGNTQSRDAHKHLIENMNWCISTEIKYFDLVLHKCCQHMAEVCCFCCLEYTTFKIFIKSLKKTLVGPSWFLVVNIWLLHESCWNH